ncbi:MAG TPA: hypothetical protein VLV45_02435 [Gemmatimonadales bacterium]|nr:hypothetical protein [Gemmatimonadales bacterium]
MSLRFAVSLAALAAIPAALHAQAAAAAQTRPYTEGSVWDISMIRTTDGMTDDYLRSLGQTWKRSLDEAKKQGLILSYKVIETTTSGPDDWDLLLMVEYKNWAAFDGLTDKMDPIWQKMMGNEDQQRQLMTKRLEVRHVLGDKSGQELILK